MDESELISAAKAGDRGAFDELVRRTFVDTFTLARRLTGNEEDGRDVVQDAYLRAWRGIGKFRGEAAVLDVDVPHHRERGRDAREAAPAPAGRSRSRTISSPPIQRTDLQPAAMAESAEAMERISAALDELPPKLRSVVVLKDVYDLSHEAIADELGITVAAAKVRLHRGRRKLRDVLYDEGAEAHAV